MISASHCGMNQTSRGAVLPIIFFQRDPLWTQMTVFVYYLFLQSYRPSMKPSVPSAALNITTRLSSHFFSMRRKTTFRSKENSGFLKTVLGFQTTYRDLLGNFVWISGGFYKSDVVSHFGRWWAHTHAHTRSAHSTQTSSSIPRAGVTHIRAPSIGNSSHTKCTASRYKQDLEAQTHFHRYSTITFH